MEKYKTKKEITQLSYEIVSLAIKIHKTLGPGLMESVYEKCFKYELNKYNYQFVSQLTVPIQYEEIKIEAEFRLDLLIEDIIIVELKAVEFLLPVHEAQLLTYMKLLKKPQGLLINFNVDNITKTFKPLVNEYFNLLDD